MSLYHLRADLFALTRRQLIETGAERSWILVYIQRAAVPFYSPPREMSTLVVFVAFVVNKVVSRRAQGQTYKRGAGLGSE